MTPETISRKLGFITDRIKELEDLKTFKKNPSNFHTRALERLFQLVVETAIDMSEHYLSLQGEYTVTSAESLKKLAEKGILEEELSKKLLQTVSLRNKLVHDYEKIENTLLWSYLDNFIKDYKQFVKACGKLN